MSGRDLENDTLSGLEASRTLAELHVVAFARFRVKMSDSDIKKVRALSLEILRRQLEISFILNGTPSENVGRSANMEKPTSSNPCAI